MAGVMKGGRALQAHLQQAVEKLQTKTLRVGFLEGATYPDGTPVAQVAALNEFGHTVAADEGEYFVLPRPFFRNMIHENKAGWGAALGAVLKSTGYDVDKALATMGLGMEDQLQESIRQLTSPPLAESTIARKGFDKPLIDSSHMINSTGSDVVEGSGE
ncbi:hypothetical protein [Paraburkholderia tuberum]|uniref:Uncharacterized protein n=1 Tax=Paraburkholderia tuberum TaxID=157910 RepID=A0A1H1GWS3_9BURK|nr:hypothetical protein [Paraburkholderia tuberum]SDR17611.1 hypothetical protein SAMN05445850_3129 [Paraburkholderia tuberum]